MVNGDLGNWQSGHFMGVRGVVRLLMGVAVEVALSGMDGGWRFWARVIGMGGMAMCWKITMGRVAILWELRA